MNSDELRELIVLLRKHAPGALYRAVPAEVESRILSGLVLVIHDIREYESGRFGPTVLASASIDMFFLDRFVEPFLGDRGGEVDMIIKIPLRELHAKMYIEKVSRSVHGWGSASLMSTGPFRLVGR